MKGMERVKGIEPSSSAWEAASLPLRRIRHSHMRSMTYTTSRRLVGSDTLRRHSSFCLQQTAMCEQMCDAAKAPKGAGEVLVGPSVLGGTLRNNTVVDP
jgi:hypothetical protein